MERGRRGGFLYSAAELNVTEAAAVYVESKAGHRRAAPKVRPLAQRCSRPGEVRSPPGRRRGAAAARRRLPEVADFSTLGRCAPHTNLTLALALALALTLTLTLTR